VKKPRAHVRMGRMNIINARVLHFFIIFFFFCLYLCIVLRNAPVNSEVRVCKINGGRQIKMYERTTVVSAAHDKRVVAIYFPRRQNILRWGEIRRRTTTRTTEDFRLIVSGPPRVRARD
jgi:hypothetical protein